MEAHFGIRKRFDRAEVARNEPSNSGKVGVPASDAKHESKGEDGEDVVQNKVDWIHELISTDEQGDDAQGRGQELGDCPGSREGIHNLQE